MKHILAKDAVLLLVEDDEDLATITLEYFAGQFGQITWAKNGREALSMIEKQDFDVVITDLTMPEMDGETLVESLRQTRPYLPVIVVTGNLDDDLAGQLLPLGIFDFVNKPCQVEVLLNRAKNAVMASRMIDLAWASVTSTSNGPMVEEILKQSIDRQKKVLAAQATLLKIRNLKSRPAA
jgi:DNA-binding NtrC family response regulator